jgi:hypothetical protein
MSLPAGWPQVLDFFGTPLFIAEANDRGTNRRFVVSNRPGAALVPGPAYDEYTERGESENRNRTTRLGRVKCA